MSERNILRGPPADLETYPHSLGIRMFENLKAYAETDKIAFYDVATNQKLSYKKLFELTCKLAIVLKKLGYAGKTIAVASENDIEFFIPVFAAYYLGSPVTLINFTYTDREFIHACDLVQPACIFCSNTVYPKMKHIRDTHPMNYLHQLWPLKNVENLVKRQTNISKFYPVEVNAKEHVAALMFSSGTTGLAKAVMLTHRNLNAAFTAFYDKDHLFSTMNNFLLVLPFYHGYGCNVAVATCVKGNTVNFLAKFNEKIFLSTIEKLKMDIVPLVPPLMVFLAKHPLVSKYDLSSVKTILCAAASCSKELEDAVIKRLNNIPRVYQGYGLTECTLSVISAPRFSEARSGCIGKVDKGMQVKIRNPETNEALGPNQVGEVCLKSELIMKGYYRNEKATKESFTKDGWMLTGDLAYYDEEGYLYVVDRLKELIKYKGFQVPPAELEGLLLHHPKIMDAGVVGVPDDLAGELPLAFVVRKPGVELNEQEVKDFIKDQVSHAKQLHGGVRFIDAIPKSPSGKILRRELRALLKKSKL